MPQIDSLTIKLHEIECLFLCDEPMNRHTSFKIGGAAEIFIMPKNEAQAAAAIAFCRELGVEYIIVGNGSNLLAPDEGIKGAVIAFSKPMSDIIREENAVWAQAGATLSQLCCFAQRQGLAGLEFAYGIPGSVGGAVHMNAGAYGGEIKDAASFIRVLNQDGSFADIPACQAGFGYRTSRFQSQGQVICGAKFALTPGEPLEIDARMKDILARRADKQPLEFPSAGSAFKRPENGYASQLIDRCGLKGFAVGGAQVSAKHAGFVVNTGGASCRDVLKLLKHVKNEVFKQTGVLLEPEVKYLGKDEEI